MPNESRILRGSPIPSIRTAAFLTLLTVGGSFAWTASGTVKNKSGSALSGVAVTVQDSASYSTQTDGSGAFSLGSPMGIQSGFGRLSETRAQIVGNELFVHSSLDAPMTLSLVDAAGKSLWSAQAFPRQGTARAVLPSQIRSGAAYLQVRGAGEEFAVGVAVGPQGLTIASEPALARSLAAYPVLQFKKTGYKDTTYAMASATASLAIVMRDTTTVITTCPTAKLSSGDQNKTISVNGVSRKYILHVPAGYTGTSPVPLLVDYHPIGGSAAGQSSGTLYKAPADKDGVISVYPDGLTGPMGQAWNVQGCCTTADDTSFVRAMVTEVKSLACIDPKRIYAAGFSMGGGMTHFSACHLSDIFAAGAPAAFDLTQQNVGACKLTHPMTMVMFRGTADNVVAYAGGHSAVVTGMAIDFLGAKATFAKWAELNQCTGSPSAEDSKGCSTYSTCAGGVQVTLCTKQGGGHEQGDGSVGWPILKKYTLP